MTYHSLLTSIYCAVLMYDPDSSQSLYSSSSTSCIITKEHAKYQQYTYVPEHRVNQTDSLVTLPMVHLWTNVILLREKRRIRPGAIPSYDSSSLTTVLVSVRCCFRTSLLRHNLIIHEGKTMIPAAGLCHSPSSLLICTCSPLVLLSLLLLDWEGWWCAVG